MSGLSIKNLVILIMGHKINFIAIALTGILSIIPVKIQAQKSFEMHSSVECLALNMYYEARSQGTAGVFAVSAVVLNRVND